MNLFDDDWGVDNSKIDNTHITSTILYFSEAELKQFKKLCKIGIRKEYKEKAISEGNLSDFLLKILKEKYENN